MDAHALEVRREFVAWLARTALVIHGQLFVRPTLCTVFNLRDVAFERLASEILVQSKARLALGALIILGALLEISAGGAGLDVAGQFIAAKLRCDFPARCTGAALLIISGFMSWSAFCTSRLRSKRAVVRHALEVLGEFVAVVALLALIVRSAF